MLYHKCSTTESVHASHLVFDLVIWFYFYDLGLAETPWKTSDARLVLEDGSIWRAKSFGASGTQVGEVVFNTSMIG